MYIYIYKYPCTHIYHHHHHQVMMIALIPLTLSDQYVTYMMGGR